MLKAAKETKMDDLNLSQVRHQRDQLLKQSDWTLMADSALTDAEKAQWAAYRKELRDLPLNISADEENWFDVAFPVRPQKTD